MSELKNLVAKGIEQGFLRKGEILDLLPGKIVDPEQIEDILQMLRDMGIEIRESNEKKGKT